MKVSMLLLLLDMEDEEVRATSHMTLRACDHYASSTLIGGKSGAWSNFASHLRLRDQRSI